MRTTSSSSDEYLDSGSNTELRAACCLACEPLDGNRAQAEGVDQSMSRAAWLNNGVITAVDSFEDR